MTDAFFNDIERMKALQLELADLAAAVLSRMPAEMVDAAIERRTAMVLDMEQKPVLECTLAMCEVMYGILEFIENESIQGYVRANSLTDPLEEAAADE